MATAKQIIAATFSSCSSEIEEYRYQPTQIKRAVYAIGDAYFCTGKYPAKDVDVEWKRFGDQFWADKHGTTLWVGYAKENI